MTDFYSALSRTIAETGANTPEARTALYERVQGLLADRFQTDRAQWPASRMRAELTRFEEAVSRIEVEFTRKERIQASDRPDVRESARHPGARRMPEVALPQPKRRIGVSIAVTLLAVAATSLAIFLGYLYGQRPSTTTTPESTARAKAPPGRAVTQPANFGIDTEELPPGVDGGSSETGLAYFNRRQPIYFRTVYSEGMIVIDRSQRFLYLVQPKSIALRYGIGVGGECPRHVGLQRISRTVEWPEWVPSPDLLKRGSYPPRVAGGPGNPLGARVLYFESDAVGIHGTNAPKSIGNAMSLGCYRMVNDSIIDLSKRIAPGAGVVFLN